MGLDEDCDAGFLYPALLLQLLFPTIFSLVKLVYYCDFFDEELTLPYLSSVLSRIDALLCAHVLSYCWIRAVHENLHILDQS